MNNRGSAMPGDGPYPNLPRPLGRLPVAAALFALFLALVLLGTAFSDPVQASTGVINGSVVNVRSGPGVQHDLVGTLLGDTEVTILSSSDNWHQIRYESLTGWVSGSLIKVREPGIELMVNQTIVNLRAGPGTSHDIVGQARQGDTLSLINQSGDWYQVRTSNGTLGYIAAFLVEKKTAPAPDTNQATLASAATPAAVLAPSPVAAAPTVIFNQKQLSFDVPPIIQNGRTLVPLRAIFEAMGAQVGWDQATRTVTSHRGDTTIILAIGSTQPTVNGKLWPLDVPAQIMQDRTLAPLRFVGEAFGGTVDWDQATRTVNITLKDPLPAINPQPVAENITVQVMGSSVNLRSGPSTLYDAMGLARSGDRFSVIGRQDDWYQVSRGGTVSWIAAWLVEQETEEIIPPVLQHPTAEQPQEKKEEIPETPKPQDPPNNNDTRERVDIILNKDQGGVKIIMQSSRNLGASIDETGNTVSYRFQDLAPGTNSNFKESLGPGILDVSTRDYGSYTQVEIKVPAGLQYRTYSEDNGRREIVHIPNYISRIERSSFGSTGEKIIIETALPSSHHILQRGDVLEVVLSNTLVGEIPRQYSYTSNLLRTVELTTQSAAALTTVEIRTMDLGKHAVGVTNGDREIHVYMIGARELTTPKNLVILDPGHGGRDPGARGPAGLTEKEANLNIALRTGEILKSQGIEVAYTRTTDVAVSLNERTEYANMTNAALFVSIHNNGHTDPSKNGTETYFYAPMSNPQLFLQREERSRLAKLLQQEMVSALKRPDRGVKESNFYVLRLTKMPSALVEVVFTTNPQEEAMLRDQNIINQAAESIARAISRYMR